MRAEGVTGTPEPSWEGRHPGVAEWWAFDLCSPDGSLAGFVGLVFAGPTAWFWAGLVGDRRPYVLVRDLDVEPPRSAASRGIRSSGLWADVNCETPFEHWSVGLEAFAVGMDDPREALGDERGDRVGLGLDLEWESVAPVVGGEGAYDQACAVHGEILVGVAADVETVAFDGHGWRRHGWGRLEAFTTARSWLGGRLDDGSPYGAEGVESDGVQVRHRAPLVLDGGVERTVLERVVCRFTAPDGRSGLGWAEWLDPVRAPSSPVRKGPGQR